MVSLFVGNLAEYEKDPSVTYVTRFGKPQINDKRVQASVEATFRFGKQSDALKFPFSLHASGVHRYCFWNIYAGLAIGLALLEKTINSNKSWSLFATPWGFLLDAMGRQATMFSTSPFVTFLIFIAIFGSFIYYFSFAMAKAYIIELIGLKKLSSQTEGEFLIFKEPDIVDYSRCIGYAMCLTIPVGIIYS